MYREFPHTPERMLPAVNPTVIYKALADGAVLFAPNIEIYFGLNEVGARVWEALPAANGSFDQLCASIGALYPDVPAATIRQDVQELLDDLVRQGLATAPGARSDATSAS